MGFSHYLLKKKVSHLIAPKLSILFKILLRLGSFSPHCHKPTVTPTPKGAYASSLPQEHRPISIIPILAEIFECLLDKLLTNDFDKHITNSNLVSIRDLVCHAVL